MTPRAAALGTILVTLLALAFGVWRSQLFTVQKPGDVPHPLAAIAPARRVPARLDVVLPVVPAGMLRLRGGDGPLLVHYWAPWERHGRAQAAGLDSLRRLPGVEGLTVVVACFDPFPSVARYVARHRLGLTVLLDTHRDLRVALPCPSIPYTYVLDGAGRIAVEQAGEVDWLAPETLRALRDLAAQAREPREPATSPVSAGGRDGVSVAASGAAGG